jgi:glutathione synthase/RimK-type ligase-like ATP-grasp enzyme
VLLLITSHGNWPPRQKVGLEIPPTLMKSDPEKAREFWRMYDGHVIYKQFLALSETWRETRPLRPQDVERIEAVRLTPVIFQRYVEAVADLRLIVIGDEFFAAAADVRKAEYPFDVRYNLNASYERHTLPPVLEDKLRALMRHRELEYGAIDMRLTPDGRYIFLR